jgi:glutathione S-transferase
MTRYVVRRLLLFVPTLWVIATLTFFLMRLAPGGPFNAEREIPQAARAALAQKYGLDRPLAVQYVTFLARAARLDFGPSYKFPARQVRRLPYLFSIALPDAEFADLPARLRPTAPPGFPPTHALLDEAYASLLAALEALLATQPFLFGERFTLADASVYGQLGMNRADPSANARLRHAAPAVHAWVERLARGDFSGHRLGGEIALREAHTPLLGWIGATFVPLMKQNHDAWQQHTARGETRFNERGFDAGRSLYDGVLRGRPFRSVAKTFQVRVWRDLRAIWTSLDADARGRDTGRRRRWQRQCGHDPDQPRRADRCAR